MTKFFKVVSILLFFFLLFRPAVSYAKTPSFVSIVNPIRGYDFWDQKNQKIEDAVIGQMSILRQANLAATWLIRFDALDEKNITEKLRNSADEKGLFLEITPSWANQAKLKYHTSESWHSAGSALLTGYEPVEREKLIDTAFDKFKKTFGFYPVSVGAWWIDAHSLKFMQEKYGIVASLIVSDQYTTDNYQIWGQYFSTPFYPSKNNALHPAQSLDKKIPVVTLQWAARDPINSYGNGVSESTFSIQANDYMDYHNLDTKYFSKLLDIYNNQPFNKFSHLVVGLENSYSWEKYKTEYENQIKVLVEKRNSGQIAIVSMKDFSNWYKLNFPDLSPQHLIIADDSLRSDKKVVWYMNPYYRAGWFYTKDGSVFRDIRQYVDGEEELCFQKRCDEVNFATSATRVLDEVSFGHKWVIDEGRIKNFNVSAGNDNFVIAYENEAGSKRKIEFLQRDISIDGKISSIDSTILNVTKQDIERGKNQSQFAKGVFSWSFSSALLKTIKFAIFLLVGVVLPGLVLTLKVFDKPPPFLYRIFLSSVSGLVVLTLIFYIFSLLNIRPLIYGYFLIAFLIFFGNYKILKQFSFPKIKDSLDVTTLAAVLAGVIFQVIPTFKSGLSFPYGIGFWGPNTHDGTWHIALINQLIKNVPPQNPIFSGEVLKNYHYFYDLLLAATSFLTSLPVVDLVFRCYPIILSLLLGIGTYYLMQVLFKEIFNSRQLKIATLFSLYFVYFAGSFGWIVEYLRERHLGGESAFWANQSISFNLNPPFAASLIIVIAIFCFLTRPFKNNKLLFILLTILCGSLISFKAYGGILILLSLAIFGILKKSLFHFLVFAASVLVSATLFISNFSIGEKLLIFSPFWFIHSMIDSPDRVGWFRLSLTRTVGLSQGNWFKFLGAEVLSLVIFILGNLGTRAISLLTTLRLKTIFKNDQFFFLFIFSCFSLFIPTLFIQAGNPWNTIQFIYYFLYIAAVVNGLVILRILVGFKKIIAVPIVLLILLITPINSWATANGYLSYQPHALISEKEIEALQFLKAESDGVVLTYPYDSNLKRRMSEPWPLLVYDSTAYVSAMSGKQVFLEDESQNQILLNDYKKRLALSKDFFSKPSVAGLKFLADNHIKYIYLPKIFNIRLEEEQTGTKNIFENKEIIIYQFKLK